jgi:hypothetical protein
VFSETLHYENMCGSGGIAPRVLNLGARWRFAPIGERAAGTHWIEGWVGPRAGLDPVEQGCPTFLYIGAHLTDGCGGAGVVCRLQ